jgi:aminomethyltransferase
VKVGRAKYGLILTASGGILDDLITYRLADDEFLVVPNAGNAPAVAEALVARAEEFVSQHAAGADVTVTDESAQTSLVAVQGPQSEAVVRTIVAEADQQTVADLGYYGWATVALEAGAASGPVLLARTGYTGEDGFEIYLGNDRAQGVWEALVAGAQGAGIELTPCGLAARDSLRLEAGMPLYGNEISQDTIAADLGMGKVAVNALKREHLFAREAIAQQVETEPARQLVGLVSDGRRAARAGSAVLVDGQEVGVVSSGQPSPTLGHPIALAFLDREHAAVGTELEVDIRGKAHPFRVVDLPFYTRG